MVFIFPSRLFAVEEFKEPLPTNFISCGFNKKGAATARADKRINLLDQIFW
jgi:hypothetical protein